MALEPSFSSTKLDKIRNLYFGVHSGPVTATRRQVFLTVHKISNASASIGTRIKFPSTFSTVLFGDIPSC